MRRGRKQRGGASLLGDDADTVPSFACTIDSMPSRNPTQFLLSVDGQGWPPIKAVGARTPTLIEDVVNNWKYDNTAVAGVGQSLPMNPLRVEDDKTWERLQEIFNQITRSKAGPSLASYRAYLLAKSKSVAKDVDGKPSVAVETDFCNDKLPSSQTIVHTPGYATLQSLHLDGYEYDSKSRQLLDYNELPELLALTPNADILAPLYVQHGQSFVTPLPFDPPPPTFLQDFKFKRETFGANQCESVKGDKAARLLSAYAELRDMYDKHLNWVYWLLKKLVVVDLRTTENDVKIQFTPYLMANPAKLSASRMMESVIRAARKTIMAHYLRVEQVYDRALRATL